MLRTSFNQINSSVVRNSLHLKGFVGLRFITTKGDLNRVDREGETEESQRARLKYQSRKRGILETDLLLSNFAKTKLDKYSVSDLQEYDRLLDEPDWDILYWSSGEREIPERWKNSKVLKELSAYCRSRRNHTLRMPNLF
ncbi:succinate dehydrogenase subunit Emi5 [Schizosaccharomyces cryophilus OY26]|uniref:Succinate dehydrogenase assembly factor 2, mitochondrial n=1 Tax=Schizosaccharomyces cryophilus (strain OY26 / ATCC MYA-4695 / CBS 11777 / NBRC 106824 / NRRL Y48691) TaxID=653667 RepID=S9VW24_SCHCR|nr:succinate dehydrogenase subunit Emi5 [Schizosaccharomyces cryophilus OY26]EPY50424.1 succinate dehydrogenase subunit Emi5 [Schizosaccharomyces cryophilus OY26]